MRHMIARIKNANNSTWSASFAIAVLSVINWLLYGHILAYDFFDKHLAFTKVLDSKGDVLTFVTIIFAVQIPLFILLLEKMLNAGHIRRLVLPGVIQFREILISYVLLSLLLLVAPKNAFYYFPAAMLTFISVFAVFEAIRTMFEPRKLKPREDTYIRRMLRQVLQSSFNFRLTSNEFFEELKKYKYLDHALQSFMGHDATVKRMDVFAKRDGVVKRVDIKRLEELMKENFPSVDSAKTPTKEKDRSGDRKPKLPQLVLMIRPGSSVTKEEALMRLTVPAGFDLPDRRFLDQLRKCVALYPEHPDSAKQQLDEILKDYKQQLHSAVESDDAVNLQAPLNYSKLINEELQDFIASKITPDEDYSFKNARNEFHAFYGDDVSDRLQSISEVITDEMLHAIQEKKVEATKELTTFAYRDVLAVTEDFNTLSAARADYSMIFPVQRLLYIKDNFIKDSEFRDESVQNIMFRIKEHTGLMLYKYRYSEEQVGITKDQLGEWLKTRLNDMREILLGSHKTSNENTFKQALGIAEEFEQDYRYHEDEIEELVFRERCIIFIVAAYAFERGNETAEQKKSRESVVKLLENYDQRELTKILVACVDKDYADDWSVDRFDLVADGQMHSIPDFGAKLKSLWAYLMMQRGAPPTDIEYYDSDAIAKTLTFSDGLSKPEDSYLVKHLTDKASEPNAPELKELVLKFIDHRKQFEQTTLIDKPLSETKVSSFKAEVLKGYKENSLLINLFSKARAVEFNTKAKTGFLGLGWNQVFEKAAFIDNWHMGYGMQGDQHGSDIANKQNQNITSELLKDPVQKGSIEEWLKELQKDKKEKWAVFTVGIGTWYYPHNYSKLLKNGRMSKDNRFKNVSQIMPMEYVFNNTLPKGLYAAPVKDLGVIRTRESKAEPVSVNIDAYSHDSDLLKAIIDSPPAWLKKKGTKADQETFLKTMVRMYINHTYQYKVKATKRVYYFPIKRDY